ncbi:MAG: hypothetical protein WC855_11505 [Thermodesulfovibrionales bacterium]
MLRIINTVTMIMVISFLAACSTAHYQVMQKGTYQPGVPISSQKPTILQNVEANAPGGTASTVIVYFGADKAPIVEAAGDSSALVQATASVGRTAFDIAVKLSKTGAGIP